MAVPLVSGRTVRPHPLLLAALARAQSASMQFACQLLRSANLEPGFLQGTADRRIICTSG